MIKKIFDRESQYKLKFLIITSFLLVFFCFTTAYSAEKNIKGAGEIENNILNLSDFELGKVTEEGIIYNRNGRVVGTVDKDGIIYNVSKIKIGKTEPDGSVLNQLGVKLASVNEQGDIFNRNGRKIGSVKNISDIKLIGGAARLIFF